MAKKYDSGDFGQNLRRIRRAADVTQEQLADQTGIDLGSIRRYEKGKNTPGLDKVVQLATALGVTLNDLYPIETEVA